MSSILFNPFKSAPPTIPLAARGVEGAERGQTEDRRGTGLISGGGAGVWWLPPEGKSLSAKENFVLQGLGLSDLNLVPRYAISKTKVWKARL